MPTPTYVALATVTLSSSPATITFSSIPNTYRDLVLIFSGKTTSSGTASVEIFFNGDQTVTNYSHYGMWADGSTFGTANTTRAVFAASVEQNTSVINIMDYSSSVKQKTVISRSGSIQEVDFFGCKWISTAPITSILLKDAGNGFVFSSGSVVSLYGIEG